MKQLQKIIENSSDIDALYISNLNNIWYLLKFSASFARLIITKNKIIFLIIITVLRNEVLLDENLHMILFSNSIRLIRRFFIKI